MLSSSRHGFLEGEIREVVVMIGLVLAVEQGQERGAGMQRCCGKFPLGPLEDVCDLLACGHSLVFLRGMALKGLPVDRRTVKKSDNVGLQRGRRKKQACETFTFCKWGIA